MFCFQKPISILISPNTQKDDVFLALKVLFSAFGGPAVGGQPWKEGEKIKELEGEFKKYLGTKHAFSFNSGRSAFLAILESLNLEKGSEVLLQAFTCNAAVNPILWAHFRPSGSGGQAGLKPVFVDCNKNTLNIDVNDLEKKITEKSRVVIVQHTFGLPAEINEVLEVCQKNNLILIEDCAHSLGAEYKEKKIGTFGKAAFFSFGRDKVISSVHGGMVVTNDTFLAREIKEFQEKAGYPSYSWILQQILHPLLMNWLILPTYNFLNLGKAILVVLQSSRVLSKAVFLKEKQGKKPACFPKRLPNALAVLALNQFKKLEEFNQHRQKIAIFFDKNLKGFEIVLPEKRIGRIYMKYSVLFKNNTDKANKILKKAQRENILLDDGWRKTPIVPPDTNQLKMGYTMGTCLTAERISSSILNLPTHINISHKEAQKIVNFLKNNV